MTVELRFIMPVEKYGWAIQETLFEWTSQDSRISQTHRNLKMFGQTTAKT